MRVMADDMDGLNAQLIWSRLLAIVEEQAQALMRTAFSTVVREAGDLSAGVFTPGANAGPGGHGHAGSRQRHGRVGWQISARLSAGGIAARRCAAHQRSLGWHRTSERLHRGDARILQRSCVGLFASTSHIADVGGRGFGPDANDRVRRRVDGSHQLRCSAKG